MRRAFASLAMLTAFALSTSQAEGSFTIALSSVTASGSNFSYNYTATIAAGDVIKSGDFFRIYDFAGYVSNSLPSGWSITDMSVLNPTPPPNVILTLGDNNLTKNLTFTYSGSDITGSTSIGFFSVVSTYASIGFQKNFVGRVSSGITPGTFNDSVGSIGVPDGGIDPNPNATPEPTSILMLGLGVAGVYGMSSRARRKVRA